MMCMINNLSNSVILRSVGFFFFFIALYSYLYSDVRISIAYVRRNGEKNSEILKYDTYKKKEEGVE